MAKAVVKDGYVYMNIDEPVAEARTMGFHQQTSFKGYYNNMELSDVKLVVGSDTYHAHRLVLVVASKMFETMLMHVSTLRIVFTEALLSWPRVSGIHSFLFVLLSLVLVISSVVIIVNQFVSICIDFMMSI